MTTPLDRLNGSSLRSAMGQSFDIARIVQVFRHAQLVISHDDAADLWRDLSARQHSAWVPLPSSDDALMALCAEQGLIADQTGFVH